MCLIILPSVAQGQGFGISEQGACAMSRASASVAEPCEDGSAIYFNPAALAGAKRTVLGGGGTPIFGSSRFTGDNGTTTKQKKTFLGSPVHFYFQYGLNEKVSLGVGFYTPYGLGVEWPLDFGGRFVTHQADLLTGYLQPTLAYAVNDRVAVGGGLTVAISSVTLKRREDLARVPLAGAPGLTFGALVESHTDFVDTSLTASKASGTGANVGVLFKANDRVRIGARYLTKVTIAYDGTAVFAPIAGTYRVTKTNALGLPVGTPLNPFVSEVQAALQSQATSTELPMPAHVAVGLSVHAHPRLKLFGEYQWVGWSAFKSVVLDFSKPIPADDVMVQNYRNTSTERFGLELEIRPAVWVRGGYFHNQAAAPDETVTPILPEAARNHFTAGIGVTLNRTFTLDVAYQFIHQDDRRGRIVNPPPGALPTVALNSGVYRARSNLLGMTLTVRP